MAEIVEEAMYLELFHGRKDPGKVLEDWGEQGPIIGPLTSVHGTYQSTIRIRLKGEYDLHFLRFYEDMIVYDDWFYGDWWLTTGKELLLNEDWEGRVQQYDPEKAVLPTHLAVFEDL